MLLLLVALLLALVFRFITILPRSKPVEPRSRGKPCRFGVFLGSGGHTSEALALVSALDFARYAPRTYIVSEGDTLSAEKAIALEKSRSSDPVSYQILVIPRARHVHQSLLMTPPTALWSLVHCVWNISIPSLLPRMALRQILPVDVLLVNGPGTCVTLCIAVYINKFMGLRSPKLIYVESFARVNSLSLSGRLLRHVVDRFIVQWPDALADGRRGECMGWLV